MSNIDCKKSKYSNLPVCICERGINAYIDAKEKYEEELAHHQLEDASWSEWNAMNTAREQITGDYRSYYDNRKVELQNDTRDTRNYMDTENARQGNHDDYCINDYGADWTHIPEDISNSKKTLKMNSPGFYFGKCQRTDTAIDRIIKEEMLANYPAYTKTSDQRQGWTKDNRPVMSATQPNPLNITCCTQIIDDIKVGTSVDINNISQKCGNSTQNQENIASTETSPVLKTKYYIKNYYMYIIGILVIIFSICSILSMFIGDDSPSNSGNNMNYSGYYDNYGYE